MRFSIRALWIAVLILETSFTSLADPSDEELPFELRWDLIIVRGTIDGSHSARMMIDTGASCTVIDRRLAKKLRLKRLSKAGVWNTSGRKLSLETVIVPKLRVGPVETTLACFVEDLSELKVDVIVGLNVLRRYDFTVDFSSRQIIFGRPPRVADSLVPFDPQESLVVVPVEIKSRILRLIVDTGASDSSFNCSEVYDWISGHSKWNIMREQLGGRLEAREVYVPEFRLGSSQWKPLKVLVLKCGRGSPKPRWSGVLAPVSLRLSWMHFNFQRGILSWGR